MNSTECNRASNDSQQIFERRFSAPMPWVGVYVAAASLLCTLAMAADVFHGFRHKKLWFPCKYFTLNAASLTVIAVAMKLPVDLNNSMPRTIDQLAKISSSGFMCIMMANLLPSLGPMSSIDLLMNITALGILTITIIVNVFIQMSTGLISKFDETIFQIFMLYLLTLFISSALVVPISKNILLNKYLEMHKIVLTENSEHIGRSCTAEKLIQDVSKYWIMTETSNPQFVLARSPTCAASGVFSFLVVFFLLLQVGTSSEVLRYPFQGDSDYRWSVLPILSIQTIGVVVGAIAPFFRLFRVFSFKLSLKQSKKYLHVYRIRNYWIQTLVDWKSSRLPFQLGGLKCQKVIYEFRNLSLNSLIGLQIFIVVISKISQFVSFLLVIMFASSWYCCTWLSRKVTANLCASKDYENSESEQHGTEMLDLSPYVLQLEDEVELANRTLQSISKAVHRLIREAEKKQPTNLMTLLEKSTGFEGVAKFDNRKFQPLHSSQIPNSWSLVVVTLTSIVTALPKAKDGTNDFLLIGISEGLLLVRLVEESLYPTEGNLVNVRKAANSIWLQVEIYRKWMDEDLQNRAHRGKTSVEILQWLGDKAQKILMEYKKSMYVGSADSSFLKVIAANSMYRISRSILMNYEGRNTQTNEMLIDELTIMIADILSACLSNIQRVIVKKCDANANGNREADVKTAAQLVGQTKKIMKLLQQRELPRLDPNKLGFIDEWHAFLNSSSNSETFSSSSSQLLSIDIE